MISNEKEEMVQIQLCVTQSPEKANTESTGRPAKRIRQRQRHQTQIKSDTHTHRRRKKTEDGEQRNHHSLEPAISAMARFYRPPPH